MKIKTLILAALVLLSYGGAINAQEQDSVAQKDNMRTVYFSLGIGFPEYIGTRLGYQINEDWSLYAKLGLFHTDEGDLLGALTTWGGGITVHFKDWGVINYTSAFFGYNSSLGNFNYTWEILTGYDSPFSSLISVYWAIGLGVVHPEYRKSFTSPSLKIGFNLNL